MRGEDEGEKREPRSQHRSPSGRIYGVRRGQKFNRKWLGAGKSQSSRSRSIDRGSGMNQESGDDTAGRRWEAARQIKDVGEVSQVPITCIYSDVYL